MGEPREVAERFFERFGAGDIAGAMECFAPECVSVTPTGPLNNAKHGAAAQALKGALPDSRMELIRVLESGDEVYVTGRFKRTHENDLPDTAGDDPCIRQDAGLALRRLLPRVDGKIVQCEAVRDRLDMILQLGGIPAR